MLAGYTIFIDKDKDGVQDPGEVLTTDNSGQVVFTAIEGIYDIYETSLPSGYGFVTWGDGVTNVGGLDNQGTITVVGDIANTGTVTNKLTDL